MDSVSSPRPFQCVKAMQQRMPSHSRRMVLFVGPCYPFERHVIRALDNCSSCTGLPLPETQKLQLSSFLIYDDDSTSTGNRFQLDPAGVADCAWSETAWQRATLQLKRALTMLYLMISHADAGSRVKPGAGRRCNCVLQTAARAHVESTYWQTRSACVCAAWPSMPLS